MNKYFFILFLFLGNSLVSCNKSDSTSDSSKGDDVVVEKDVTADASMTVNIENGGGANGTEGSSKLIDDNPLTKFLVQDIKDGLNVLFRFSKPVQVASYKITSGNDADSRDPMDWKLYGSNDAKSWVMLNRQDYEMFAKRNYAKRYYFKNNQKYTYYRWEVSKVYAGQMFQASEFRLITQPEKQQTINPITFIDTIDRDGLRLLFVNKARGFSNSVKNDMINVFFTNYPKLLRDFNPNGQKTVAFRIEPEYTGVAFVFGGMATYGSEYMNNNSNDVDVVTHEIMHLIQSYSGAPGWVTEGIADYVRYKYGLYNARAGWTLGGYSSTQKYTDAYRVTARFLVWIEKNYDADFVKKLDSALRNRAYTDNYWKEQTGKTVDELWALYGQNPSI